MPDPSEFSKRQERERRCNRVLERVGQEGGPLREEVRSHMKEVFFKDGHPLSEASYSRYVRKVPTNSSSTKLVLQYVETRLVDFLKKHLQETPSNQKLLDEIDGLLHGPENEFSPLHAAASEQMKNQGNAFIELPKGRALTNVALKHLFEMYETQYSVSSAIEGEYFGYRLSANSAEIIQFYINISVDKDSGLLRFMIRYRRHGQHWLIKGFGFDVERTTYLLGHAVSETDTRNPPKSLGLRCFALLNYGHYGWFVGPLISMDNRQDPIAARVVLVPINQHRSIQSAPESERLNFIMKMIEREVTTDAIDHEIAVRDVDNNDPFADVSCSIHLRSLIWNGTFTTLHGYQKPPEKDEISSYKQLFDLQRLAIDLANFSQNNMSPFFTIANKVSDLSLIPEG